MIELPSPSGKTILIGNDQPLVIIGGVNVLESEALVLEVADHFYQVCTKLNLPWIFKGSFDKANRSSVHSYRGPGLEKGLALLTLVKEKFNVPVLTDVHEIDQCAPASQVADILQLPAFLARQTDLISAIASHAKIVNIKKPQFMSPEQTMHIVKKFQHLNLHSIMLCERGTCFGYDNLVVDMLGFDVMKNCSQNAPIIFDVTHSLQCRASGGEASGGRRSQFLSLAKAGIATKLAGLFVEAHPDPDHALCDGPSALPLYQLEAILSQLKSLDQLIKAMKPIDIQ